MSAVITGYVLVILVVTMLLGFGLYSQVTRHLLDTHTERLALVVAQSVAANQSVRSEMASESPIIPPPMIMISQDFIRQWPMVSG